MDPVLGQLPPPPYYENESQRKRNNEADRYKIMRRLTIALVFLIWIIFLLAFPVAALLLNLKFNLSGRVRRETKSGAYWSSDRWNTASVLHSKIKSLQHVFTFPKNYCLAACRTLRFITTNKCYNFSIVEWSNFKQSHSSMSKTIIELINCSILD